MDPWRKPPERASNQTYPMIKFTAEWSMDSVSSLYIRATLKERRIQTDLYSKPTDMTNT